MHSKEFLVILGRIIKTSDFAVARIDPRSDVNLTLRNVLVDVGGEAHFVSGDLTDGAGPKKTKQNWRRLLAN